MRNAEKIVDSILQKRGFVSNEDRIEFLSNKPINTYDPYLLPDIEEGTDLLFSALSNGDKICIYGDYDADGIMSTVLVSSFLSFISESEASPVESSKSEAEKQSSSSIIDWYIPSRFDEGYGLNCAAIDTINQRGAKLIITVDCGSVSPDEIKYAKSLGLNIIVTDHHQCNIDALPECPIINPSRSDSEYPFPSLSGCGVAFKTMEAFRKKYYPENTSFRKALNEMLDLVAIATVADVVSLTDENRTLVKYGLKSIHSGNRLALKKLCDRIELDYSTITSMNIGYRIGPHINAAGRLSDASQVIELFLTKDVDEMDEIITNLIALNNERQKIQGIAEEECIEIVEKKYPNDNFLLVRPDSIHEGVSGIVAGKLKTYYNRPSAVLAVSEDKSEPGDELDAKSNTIHNNPSKQNTIGSNYSNPKLLKGSSRSIIGIDLISMLRRHKELFIKLGGHEMAAGFTIPEENEEALRKALNEEIAAMLKENDSLFDEVFHVDEEIEIEEVNLELAELLTMFEPTGTNNTSPLFLISNPKISNVRMIGNDGKHMSFNVNRTRCIFFSPDDDSVRIISDANNDTSFKDSSNKESSNQIELLTEININNYNGYQNVQLVIRKARKSS